MGHLFTCIVLIICAVSTLADGPSNNVLPEIRLQVAAAADRVFSACVTADPDVFALDGSADVLIIQPYKFDRDVWVTGLHILHWANGVHHIAARVILPPSAAGVAQGIPQDTEADDGPAGPVSGPGGDMLMLSLPWFYEKGSGTPVPRGAVLLVECHFTKGTVVTSVLTSALELHVSSTAPEYLAMWANWAFGLFDQWEEHARATAENSKVIFMNATFALHPSCEAAADDVVQYAFAAHAHEHALSVELAVTAPPDGGTGTQAQMRAVVPKERISQGGMTRGTFYELWQGEELLRFARARTITVGMVPLQHTPSRCRGPPQHTPIALPGYIGGI